MLERPDPPPGGTTLAGPKGLDLTDKIARALSANRVSNLGELSGRVAIFGGTFDPPQVSHPIIGQAAANAHEIDTVLFMPTFKNRLKDHFPAASPQQRLEMLCLLCGIDARFRVSDWELNQGMFVYTADTLKEVRQTAPKISQLMFIMGSDLLCHFATWPRRDELLEIAQVIPVSAKEFHFSQLGTLEEALGISAVQQLRDNWVDIPIQNTRSTNIREELVEGHYTAIEHQLPPMVLEYIRWRGLYTATSG